MIAIAIDAGNTRIKWGVHDGSGWIAQGVLPTAEVAQLAELVGLADLVAGWPAGARIVAGNVAGDETGRRIAAALAPAFPPVRWLRSSAQAGGVINGYEQPEQLGADRWAALIGARGLASRACLVVCAGTATTIDRLAADGAFRGGVILPGVELMRAALARNTAQLPFADGEFRREPRTTADAIVSGCLHAQIGAIERLFAESVDSVDLAGEPNAVCLLTGGAAPSLAPLLRIPCQRVDTLILDGLLRFSSSAA
ncbi:MAG: type III pantothenate kinase [Propionivibrio sp.]